MLQAWYREFSDHEASLYAINAEFRRCRAKRKNKGLREFGANSSHASIDKTYQQHTC
jgi:hypothetical protein